MKKRKKEECSKCEYFRSFQEIIGMDFVLCGYGVYNEYRGFYKFMDGEVNCPQNITESLKD
ncbi:MAG: hypothetical protein FWG13_06715 [Leptospirales bacterium]|nr:hypothetical protein [Leptospirales bacterium]